MAEMSNELISVLIVAGGKGSYLKTCLDSVGSQTHLALEVIVIDNSLDLGFSRQIRSLYQGIKLYSSLQNLFYCQALNIGIEMAKGDFILCLNDDITLDKDFIKEALRGFRVNPEVGMVSGKILRQDKTTIDSAGLFLSYHRCAKERGYGTRDKGQFEKQRYVFGVNGAAAFYRRTTLEDIKERDEYFDSRFHIFYEDLDVAWRAQRRGWKAYYIPSAVAYHVRGGTVRAANGIGKSYARRYLNDELHLDLIKNRYLVIIKNESALGLLLCLAGIFSYDFVMWGYILFFRPRLIKLFLRYLKNGYLPDGKNLNKTLDKNNIL